MRIKSYKNRKYKLYGVEKYKLLDFVSFELIREEIANYIFTDPNRSVPELADEYAITVAAINDFPENICLENLKTNQPFPKLYYSNRLKEEYLQVTMTVALTTLEDVETMQQFWYSTLNNMYETFNITLPIFGEQYSYVARMKSDLADTWQDGIYPKKETFTIEILNDIEAMFNKDRLDVYIEVDGGEVSFTTDGKVTVDWGYEILHQYPAGEVVGTPFQYMRITSLEEVTKITFDGDLIETIDISKGLDLVDADRMCIDLVYMDTFSIANAPNILTTRSMFENTPKLNHSPVGLDMSNVTAGEYMYKGSGVILVDHDTSSVETFTQMYQDAIRLQCIGRLNTLNATNTDDMFTNTPVLVYPSAEDQALIVQGYDWVSPIYCPFFVEVWLQNFLYDADNIKDEFTELTRMTTDHNTLEAISYDAVAVSKPYMVDAIDREVTSIRDGDSMSFEGNFVFKTISSSTSYADTLITESDLEVGDSLIIVKDDGSVHPMEATAVDSGEYYSGPPNGDLEYGDLTGWSGSRIVYLTSNGGRSQVIMANGKDTSSSTATYANITLQLGQTYTFGYWWRGEHYDKYSSMASPRVRNANGVDITTPRTEKLNFGWEYHEETFIADTEVVSIVFSGVRANTICDSMRIWGGANGMDTTAITQGEIPSRVFAVDAHVEFNIDGTFRQANTITKEYVYGDDVLTELDPFGDGSLIAKWKLDGDATDLLGNFDGTATDVVWAVDEERGTVGDFRASLSKVQTALKTSDLDMTYSVVFFAKRFGYQSYDRAASEAGRYGFSYDFDGRDSISFDSNSGGIHKGTNYDGTKMLMDQYVNMDLWNMYSYTRTNGISNSGYVNNRLLTTKDANFMTNQSSNGFQIGSDGGYKSDNFNGYISDMMVFDRELTEDEIAQLYINDYEVLLGKHSYEDFTVVDGQDHMMAKVFISNVGDSMTSLSGELHGKIAVVNCFTPLQQLTDGWYGKDTDQDIAGVIEPIYSQQGQFIYMLKFSDAGEFVISLGVTGGDKSVGDTNLLTLKTDYGELDLAWDEVDEMYEGMNIAVAEALIEELNNDVCVTFAPNILPPLVIQTDLKVLT